MTSRAESSVFWSGITLVIANMRARCPSSNERAPSHLHGPPLAAQEPVYPFQCISANFFKYKGSNYVVVVDRYSSWPIVQQSRDGSSGLVKCLREFLSHTALQTNYLQMADLNLRPRRHNNCCQTGVSIIAAHLLRLPIQTVAQSSGSSPASAYLWTTLARTARSNSTNFKEACFNTATPPTAIPVYHHR